MRRAAAAAARGKSVRLEQNPGHAARAILLAPMLLCLWLLSLPALAALPDGIRFGDTPAWVESVDVGVLAPAAAPQGMVYRAVEDQVSLLEAEPVEYRRLVYDIADRSGLEDGGRVRISFHPDYQRVVVHALGVVRKGVRSDRRAETRVELLRLEQRADDGILDGRRTAELLLPDVQVGDQVDLAYSVVGGNPVFGDGFHTIFNTTYSQPVAARRIRAVMPVDRTLFWKVTTGPGTFEETVRDGRRTLLLDLLDVAAVVEEGGLPDNFDPYGVVEMSTARDWSDVARWSVEIFRRPPPGRGALAAQARDLGLAGKAPADAARLALAFVQREVRYVSLSIGESSHAPAPPETTLSRRFGDCKDKSLLMVGLLAEAGIEAEPVLVSTRWREATAGRLASPLAFDHAIVRVRWDDQWHYFDPTRDTEVGDLGRRGPIRFAMGLPVSPATRALADIPAATLDQAGVEVTQDVAMVGEAGEERADIRVRTRYRYDEASRLRSRFRADPIDAIGKEYQDYMQGWYRDIEQVAAPKAKDRPSGNTFEVSEHYLAPFTKDKDAPDAIGDFELRLFQLADWVPEARETKRSQPLRLTGPARGVHEIRMSLEGGWDIEPETHEVGNDYFRFRLNVSADGDTLTMRGQWDRLAESIPPEAYAEVRDQLREVREKLVFPVSLGGGGATEGLVIGARDLTWPVLAMLLTAVLLAGLWWLRHRSRIAGMFFAPRATAQRLLETPSVPQALGVLALWATSSLLVGVMPEWLAGARPDWAALGWETLGVLPQMLLNVALLFGIYRLLDTRPGYRNLFITACWSLWPLILLLPLALLAAGPALPVLANEAAVTASDAPLAWVLVAAMFLMLLVGLAWTAASSVVAHSVAASCGIARTIGAYCLTLAAIFALALVGVLAYYLSTGALPGA
jgi:hypothetical protein